MLPTKNYADRPKTKSGYRVNEGNSQNMYFFYKKKTMILQEKKTI